MSERKMTGTAMGGAPGATMGLRPANGGSTRKH